jgi:hypothetical protein
LEHFLKAKCLGADLDFVCPVRFGFSAFVFDRCEGAVAVLLDDVANPNQIVFLRAHPELPKNRAIGTMFVRSLVRFLVEKLAFSGEAILSPDLLVMNERTLARAIEEVLESREENGLWRGGHDFLRSTRVVRV